MGCSSLLGCPRVLCGPVRLPTRSGGECVAPRKQIPTFRHACIAHARRSSHRNAYFLVGLQQFSRDAAPRCDQVGGRNRRTPRETGVIFPATAVDSKNVSARFHMRLWLKLVLERSSDKFWSFHGRSSAAGYSFPEIRSIGSRISSGVVFVLNVSFWPFTLREVLGQGSARLSPRRDAGRPYPPSNPETSRHFSRRNSISAGGGGGGGFLRDAEINNFATTTYK